MTATLNVEPALTFAHASDDELMARINAGAVEDCLAELRRRYGKRIYYLVLGIVRDAHIAEDVCEEVFAKVFLKSHLYRSDTNFAAWLFEVARNQALSTLRARRRLPVPVSGIDSSPLGDDDDDLLHGLASPTEATAEEHEVMAAFDQAVEELPPNYRDVFRLCVQQGVQYQSAADLLGIPTGTVAIRIMRARKRLYEKLFDHLDRIRRPPACFVN